MGYRLLRLLGVGTFGEVWETQLHHEGKVSEHRFAVKWSFCQIQHSSVQRELSLLNHIIPLTHKGIIKLNGWAEFDGRLLVLLELAEDSLLSRMRHYQTSRGFFPVSELVKYTREVAAALDYIHHQGMIHGGINPTDVLICDSCAKMADFTEVSLRQSVSWPMEIVPYYKSLCMSPELKCGEPRPESDQYALAATYAWLRLQRPIVLPMGKQIELGHLPTFEQQALGIALADHPSHRFPNCLAFAKAIEDAIRNTNAE